MLGTISHAERAVLEDLYISLHRYPHWYGVIYLPPGQDLEPDEYDLALKNGPGGKIIVKETFLSQRGLALFESRGNWHQGL
jgi:hypothetical protein